MFQFRHPNGHRIQKRRPLQVLPVVRQRQRRLLLGLFMSDIMLAFGDLSTNVAYG